MLCQLEALEIILNFNIKYPSECTPPDMISRLQPGLSRSQIDEIAKDLDYPLPEEVYELYLWRNGIRDNTGFDHFISAAGGLFTFLPLEVAIKKLQNFYQANLTSSSNYYKYEPNWLQIFSSAWEHNAAGCVVVLGEETAPIRSLDPENQFYGIINYSLTHLMLSNITRWNTFDDINFSGKNFSKGDFRNLKLYKVNLTDTNLEDADFRGADITRTNLSGANVKNIKISGAFYSDETILPKEIDKTELIYIGAGANLSELDLRGISLGGNLENANLSKVNLSRWYVNGTNLRNADLSGANLERTQLNNSDLSGANLEGANLRGAMMKKTNLTNANLLNVTWIEDWIMNRKDPDAKPIFLNTIMPDGTIKNPQ